ncbi:uncharacterized protein BKA78DRAFT_297505 [Phyllosticta capitalensis]|uniref:Uncharacterized protein n=1 Tax=Phyllosticta capitalensis TaxID=121624 RepID=A0ABR1YB70_9PEZI
MAPLEDAVAASSGNDDAQDDKSPVEDIDEVARASSPSKVNLNLSSGQELTVNIIGNDMKLKMEIDASGTLRIFGSGTENLLPMTVARPGSFDFVLSKRRFGNTFNFFGLPAELRNTIYELVFQDMLPHDENFRYKRTINPIRFLARLNKTASGGSALPFVNRQSLNETLPMLLSSKRFSLSGDKQALAFLRSLGPLGRASYAGPLRFELNEWEKATMDKHWASLLAECHNLRRITFECRPECYGYRGPIFQILTVSVGAFPKLEKTSFEPSIREVSQNCVLRYLSGPADWRIHWCGVAEDLDAAMAQSHR